MARSADDRLVESSPDSPTVAHSDIDPPTAENQHFVENEPSSTPQTGPDDRVILWLRRTDQWFLGTLLIALVVLLFAFRWKLSGGFQTEIEIIRQQPREFYYSLDINKASWVEWAQLEGIGEKLAKRIVEYRQEQGSFASIDDLRRVRGLGPKLIEKLKPFLKCEEKLETRNQ